ncbi:MAG: mercury resistance system transport protein MerF [Gammaproteobacteria bacterium]|nr:mercury resistance system transport protein MerF [Gammaproteobacteria bacterium]MDH3412934.1 mercury resistance system transport protein MerF [Gammaproteobacteria bacterium]
MRTRKLLGVGVGGTAVTAVCCFTPALVILLGGFGLSAWLAWLDYVLLPMLVAFIALTLFAVLRIRRESNREHPDG